VIPCCPSHAGERKVCMLSHVADMETEKQYMGFVVDSGVARFFLAPAACSQNGHP
jgi:hypothetical protein